jgi:multiple sugar transport system permease protein
VIAQPRHAPSGLAFRRVEKASQRIDFARQQRLFYRALLWPSLGLLGILTLLPTIFLLVTSFTPFDLTKPGTSWSFAQPLGNYRLMLEDGRLHASLWTQARLSFWSVGLQLLIGLGLALLLNLRSRILHALRTAFLIPMVLPPVVVAIIWKVLYTPDISPIYLLLTGIGIEAPVLMTDANWALTAIIIADTWEWFPFTMLMVLAALQMMPEEQIDAARVDGATAWQTVRYVTLPYLRGVLIVAGLFRLIDSIKAFPLIYILTDGGPGSATEVTNYYGFIQAFNFSYLGYSCAITVVLVTLTVALSWAVLRSLGERRDGE